MNWKDLAIRLRALVFRRQFEQDLLFFKEHCHVASHGELLNEVGEKYGVPPRLIAAICLTSATEASSHCPNIV